jgi:hypothetical protein
MILVVLLLVEMESLILEKLVKTVLKMLEPVPLFVEMESLIQEKLVRTVLKILEPVLLPNVENTVFSILTMK